MRIKVKLENPTACLRPLLPPIFLWRKIQKAKTPILMGTKNALVRQPKPRMNPIKRKYFTDTPRRIILRQIIHVNAINRAQTESFPRRAVSENHPGKKTGHNPHPIAAQFHSRAFSIVFWLLAISRHPKAPKTNPNQAKKYEVIRRKNICLLQLRVLVIK